MEERANAMPHYAGNPRRTSRKNPDKPRSFDDLPPVPAAETNDEDMT